MEGWVKFLCPQKCSQQTFRLQLWCKWPCFESNLNVGASRHLGLQKCFVDSNTSAFMMYVWTQMSEWEPPDFLWPVPWCKVCRKSGGDVRGEQEILCRIHLERVGVLITFVMSDRRKKENKQTKTKTNRKQISPNEKAVPHILLCMSKRQTADKLRIFIHTHVGFWFQFMF